MEFTSRSDKRKRMAALIIFGFFGQVAWCVENSFLNLYVYRTITTNLGVVSAMVASSAVVATLTTIIMGWVTDRAGTRRPFMIYGYLLWGISVAAFAFCTVDNMQSAFGMDHAAAITAASVLMVVIDCVMTFFGSTANDAAFNAWVTDTTTRSNRGKTEAFLSILASAAYVVIFLPFEAFGITTNKYYDAAGNPVSSPVEGGSVETGNWLLFYLLIGGLVLLSAFAGFFLIKDAPDLKPQRKMPFKDLFYGFRPSVVKRNKYLYLVLATLALECMANNCFFNYLIIYLENTMRCGDYLPMGYIIPMGLIYGLGMAAGLIVGFLLDKREDKAKFILPGIIIASVGAVGMYFFSPDFMPVGVTVLALFCIAALIQATGHSIVNVVCLATIRNLTPAGKVGRFQGIRMVFYIALPMALGSIVSGVVSSQDRYISHYDEFGHAVYVCPPIIFLLTAIVALFAIIPAIFLLRAPKGALLSPSAEEEALSPPQEVANSEM